MHYVMAQKSDEVRKSIITMCFRLLLDSNNYKTLPQNATTNGGDASRVGIEKEGKYKLH